MNQPVQQSSDLPDAIEVATSVFSAIYFNGGAWPDESLEDQMRRAMRAALISIEYKAIAAQTAEQAEPDGFIWTDGNHYEHVGYGPAPMHQQANARPFVFIDTLTAPPTQAIAKQPDDAILSLAQDAPLAIDGDAK